MRRHTHLHIHPPTHTHKHTHTHTQSELFWKFLCMWALDVNMLLSTNVASWFLHNCVMLIVHPRISHSCL